MPPFKDGPKSPLFSPIPFSGTADPAKLPREIVSEWMANAAKRAPTGDCVGHGIPFKIRRVAVVAREPVTVRIKSTRAPWFVFLHCSEVIAQEADASGFIAASRGHGRLGEHAADYEVIYADGKREVLQIRRRMQVGAFAGPWGENCFEATTFGKSHSVRPHHEQMTWGWGHSQTRATAGGDWGFQTWLWAWENPRPGSAVVALRLVPVSGVVVLFGISAGKVSSNPLRWETRRKMIWHLRGEVDFDMKLDDRGNLPQIRLDLGTVIHAERHRLYPDKGWEASLKNSAPPVSDREILVEFAAHRDARFHLPGKRALPVRGRTVNEIESVPPANRRVDLKVVDRATGKPIAVKLHVHGRAGEYLVPVDRHRHPNPAWFEDYSSDVVHNGYHTATYISGETVLDLPRGEVFVEVSRGFEVKPRRLRVRVGPNTRTITIPLDKVLRWREKGWVSADTHVHFLSPITGILEGAAEGVNVVNLLASQWGELMTNVGDFDGRMTWGSKEAGGDGEHLVRVGTENRQHVLGHISLLGYRGRIIAPMTTGGPDESALGDPVECLLSEWAERCRA